MIDISLFLFVD